jgi:hypothetical protein
MTFDAKNADLIPEWLSYIESGYIESEQAREAFLCIVGWGPL